MQKILFAIIALFSFSTTYSQIQKVELQASGLTCSMCSNSINKALNTLSFVESIETDLNKNIFTISFKPDSKPDLDAMKNKVEGAGFFVANLWAHTNFDQVSVKNDAHVSVDGVTFHFMDVKNQTLNGTKKVKLLDKNFVVAKEYKKMAKLTTMQCYETGYMDDCCNISKKVAKQRVYHVTI